MGYKFPIPPPTHRKISDWPALALNQWRGAVEHDLNGLNILSVAILGVCVVLTQNLGRGLLKLW